MDMSMDSITKGFIIFFVVVGVCALLFLPTLMLKLLIALVAVFGALGVKVFNELNSED